MIDRMAVLAFTLVASLASVAAQNPPATIHQAAQAGDVGRVAALLDATPTLINAKDENGRTALHWACRGVHVPVVRVLVERGADVNALDRSGVAPLHSVASRGDKEAAALLLAKGAAVDARTADRATPMHLAARNGHVDVAGALLERGARLEVRDATEDSPLHAAAQADKWVVVEGLVTHAPAGPTAALDAADFDGNTVLHLASRGGRADTVTLLASKGVDLNARNAMGQTAYNLAEQAGFSAVAGLLASKGADRSPPRFPRLSGPYLGQTPPGMTPQLFAKGIVSRRQGVYGTIVFSLEHGEAFWDPESKEGVLFMKTEGGFWSAPRVFPFTARPSINVPFLAPDGRRLLFMAGTRNANGMVDKEEIWVAERTPNGWSEPRPLDAAVNAVPMHWQFSLDRQGNVYLSAGGAVGGIAVARFENGRYRAPEKLPAPVNVPHTPEERFRAGELGPFVSPSGDYLLFTKFGNGGGLRVSFRQADGTWGEPRNLSERLGPGGHSAPQVTPDGRYLFFQSGGPANTPMRSFYWVDARVIDALR